MSVNASEIKKIFDSMSLKYKDNGVDSDGDHVFIFGLGARHYVDFDGKKNFMMSVQLLEHVSGSGDDDSKQARIKEEIFKLMKQALNESDESKKNEIMKEISALEDMKLETERNTEREYELISFYVPKVNKNEITERGLSEVINKINSSVKCSSLYIDRSGDLVFNYMLILEDSKVTESQIRRGLSIVVSTLDRFAEISHN